ncbi:MAG: hypothetical protein ABSF00_01805 [Candidatus Bathyarchaeia archaeon]
MAKNRRSKCRPKRVTNLNRYRGNAEETAGKAEGRTNNPWPEVGEPLDYDSDEYLYRKVRDFIHNHIDIANESWYDVLSCFVMETWIYYRFNTAPYVAFIGEVETGKTDALMTLSRLCRKGIVIDRPTSGSLSRLTSKEEPTILLDNVDKITKGDQIDIASILESGYKKGIKIPRTVGWQSADYGLLMLNIFGPRAFAANREFTEKSMQSRCLTIPMSKNVRKVERPINEQSAHELRRMLLM